MLTFVGLGLYDERDISIKGRNVVEEADRVFAEFYTSALPGATEEDLEDLYGREVEVLSRQDVEEDADEILSSAEDGDAVFLSGGDAMVSTTHADLRLRATERRIETDVVHASSVSSAVSGATGLQNYRFGASTTLPFPKGDWKPESPLDTVYQNLDRDLHTLVYLDIEDEGSEDRFMRVEQAAEILAEMDSGKRIGSGVGVARMGSGSTEVAWGSLNELAETDLGPPLHTLVIPGTLHEIEREYLGSVHSLREEKS
ncbi:MAG: diphthine synthase [Halobacteria archaeon]